MHVLRVMMVFHIHSRFLASGANYFSQMAALFDSTCGTFSCISWSNMVAWRLAHENYMKVHMPTNYGKIRVQSIPQEFQILGTSMALPLSETKSIRGNNPNLANTSVNEK